MPIQLPEVTIGCNKTALSLVIDAVAMRGFTMLRHIELNQSCTLKRPLVAQEGPKDTEMRTESMNYTDVSSGKVGSRVCVPKEREHDLVPQLGDAHAVADCCGFEICLEFTAVLVGQVYPEGEEVGDPGQDLGQFKGIGAFDK